MVEEIKKGIYSIQQVLPNNPLKYLNVYLIKTDTKHLLIDLGFRCRACEEILRSAFDELRVEPKDIDVLITHAHIDHIGTLDCFYKEFNKIFASRVTTEELWEFRQKTIGVISLTNWMGGIPIEEQVENQGAEIYECGVTLNHTVIPIEEHEVLSYGDYKFKVLDLKGHTRGQIGLYEVNEQFLMGADHVLEGISPNISFWGEDFDALGCYLRNLEKLKDMPIKTIYPAHRHTIGNVNGRVDELIMHHRERLEEIYQVMDNKKYTAFEIANSIKWNFKSGDFKSFPAMQKWFATSEILAHLEHLTSKGMISKSKRNNTCYYRK